MLVSKEHNVAFAHYMKTAGTSLQGWFKESFPDAYFVSPLNQHFPVAPSLRELRPRGWLRATRKLAFKETLRFMPAAMVAPLQPWPSRLRIIGVIRDPFEMMVSLYEFWKRHELPPDAPEIIVCARKGVFRDFLAGCVIGCYIPTYEAFFDVGGPAWTNTRLLDFNSLNSALETVCEEFGLHPPRRLQTVNSAPEGTRNLDLYREEAGPLMLVVHRHFRWYYEEGIHLMIRGRQAIRAAA